MAGIGVARPIQGRVEFIKYDGSNLKEVLEFSGMHYYFMLHTKKGCMIGIEFPRFIQIGEFYIVRETNEYISVYEKDVFKKNFEILSDGEAVKK